VNAGTTAAEKGERRDGDRPAIGMGGHSDETSKSGRRKNDSSADSDWGLAQPKSGLSRETKIGLVLVLVLAVAFGLVVLKKLRQNDEFVADGGVTTAEGEPQKNHRRKQVEPIPPYRDGSQTTFDDSKQPRRRFPASGGVAGGQKEPQTDGTKADGNPFQNVSKTGNQRDGGATSFDTGKATVSRSDGTGGNPFQSHNDDDSRNPAGSGTGNGQSTSGNPWDLGGTGKTTVSSNGTPDDSGNPFAKQPKDGEDDSTDQGTIPKEGSDARDGFRNVSRSTDDGAGTPFRTPHHQAAYQQPKDTGRYGYRNPSERDDDPDAGERDEPPRGVFGGNFEADDDHPTGDTTHTDRFPADRRFGRYRTGASGQRRASSTTTVRTAGTRDDVNYPFGKPEDSEPSRDGSATSVDTGGGSSRFPGGRDAHKTGYGSPTGNLDGDATSTDGEEIRYADDRPRVHVVKHGENYWTISRQAYGSARYFQVLVEYNRHRIPDPKRMRPGMKVLIPTIEVLQTRFPKLCPSSSKGGHTSGTSSRQQLPAGFFRDRQGNPMYRVGKSDTLSEIAHKHLGRGSRWIQVYHLNRQVIPDPNRLKIGTELRLPADASQVRFVRRPDSYR